MSKKPKSRNRSRNTRRVVQDNFEYIERVWAENGVIKTLTKTGQESTMTVKDAAMRAQQLNKAKMPGWHHAQRDRFLQMIILACREAQSQLEAPGNKKEQLVANVLAGKTAEGEAMPEQNKDEETLIVSYQTMYPTLTYDEIREVLREERLNIKRKEEMMATINSDRMFDKLDAMPQPLSSTDLPG